MLLGLGLTSLPLAGAALVVMVVYGCYYGVTEVTGWPGLAPPGRSWQVPQTMVIGASARRRVAVWGAILGPGFATRNPYAGFGLLPLAVAAMTGVRAGLALGAAIGLAHGSARALALLRDVREMPAQQAGAALGHLDLVLKSIYWRRLDGTILLVIAAAAAVAAGYHFT
jgi:hypothetical protein